MIPPQAFFTPLFVLAFGALFVANYFVFLLVPNERVMGAVQRIFYFHVGAAFACYAAFAVVLVASLFYLAKRSWRADVLSESAGEVGFTICTIVLVTGMIWGRSAWNTWFRWEEPRLVTFLVLWLIFLSFTILRNFGDPQKTSVHSSILGILGACSVPLVSLSINLLNARDQLHPKVIEHGGLKHPYYWVAFAIATGGMILFTALLMAIRYRIGCCERSQEFGEKFRGKYSE
jgi:heme exporter protein C